MYVCSADPCIFISSAAMRNKRQSLVSLGWAAHLCTSYNSSNRDVRYNIQAALRIRVKGDRYLLVANDRVISPFVG